MASNRDEPVIIIWRIYEIVDIDTGEIFKKVNNKEYKTINNEITEHYEKYVERGYLKKRRIITKRRYVKHTGQIRFEI